MGKTDLGMPGAISGKVGPVVGNSWNSKNVIETKGESLQSFRTGCTQHSIFCKTFLKNPTPFINFTYNILFRHSIDLQPITLIFKP